MSDSMNALDDPENTTQCMSSSHPIQSHLWLACLSSNIDKWYLYDSMNTSLGETCTKSSQSFNECQI